MRKLLVLVSGVLGALAVTPSAVAGPLDCLFRPWC
jgi:hypothetical protein